MISLRGFPPRPGYAVDLVQQEQVIERIGTVHELEHEDVVHTALGAADEIPDHGRDIGELDASVTSRLYLRPRRPLL